MATDQQIQAAIQAMDARLTAAQNRSDGMQAEIARLRGGMAQHLQAQHNRGQDSGGECQGG